MFDGIANTDGQGAIGRGFCAVGEPYCRATIWRHMVGTLVRVLTTFSCPEKYPTMCITIDFPRALRAI